MKQPIDKVNKYWLDEDRLIEAAASDLLAAAKLAALHFQRNQNSGIWQGDDEHEAWRVLRLAIQKAEGR